MAGQIQNGVAADITLLPGLKDPLLSWEIPNISSACFLRLIPDGGQKADRLTALNGLGVGTWEKLIPVHPMGRPEERKTVAVYLAGDVSTQPVRIFG